MPPMTHLGPAAPCGLHRYESDQFGKEYANNLFCCQFNMRKVSRHVLVPKGSTYDDEGLGLRRLGQPRLPPDRRDRGRRRLAAHRRYRRLVQALLPDVATGEAGRDRGDLPREEGRGAQGGRPARAEDRLGEGEAGRVGEAARRPAAGGATAGGR